MRIYPTARNDAHARLSRDSSENGVSSRVEACRKRLRVIRANQKVLETVEPVDGVTVAYEVDTGGKMSRGKANMGPRAERQDEVEIT